MREHRVTHPVLGAATWKAIERVAKEFRKAKGVRICSWCHATVPKGFRTRCGKSECREKLWQAQRWSRCVAMVMRRDKRCRMCGAPPAEVDHVVPVSLGGTGDLSNLRALCRPCHKEATGLLRREKSSYVARLASTGAAGRSCPATGRSTGRTRGIRA